MPNQTRPSTTAQADRVDYLMSVLCVLTILDILTLPLTAIVGIFWVKQYELPMMGEGFSTKINGKKLGQLALLLLSGAALGAFALSATQGLAVVLEQRLPGILFVMGAGHALWQDLLVAVVTAFVMELAFRRCLFFEWSRYGILPAIIGSGLITMLLTPLPQWPGALLLGLCAAAVYQVTGCLVMTSVFHMGFLVAQTLLLHGPNPQQVLSAGVMVLLLAAALVGCWAALTLSPNGKETVQKMVVQQKNPIRHPYVFRTSFNFFAVVLVLFATTVLWYPLLLGNEAT